MATLKIKREDGSPVITLIGDIGSIDEAIDLSIEKWRMIEDWHKENIDYEYEVNGSYGISCALCRYFDGTCWQCPVYLKTGRAGCTNTPYFDYVWSGNGEELYAAAKAEREFLEGVKKWWEEHHGGDTD